MKFQAHLPGLICLLLSGAGILCVPTTSPQQPPRAAAAAVADHHLQARGDLSGPPPRAGGLEKRDLTITYTNTTADTIICSGSDLVWTGYTNNISPYVADCMAIYTHFRANPGYFTVTGWTGSTLSTTATLYRSGTCLFQILPRAQADFDTDPDALGDWYFGNADIYGFVAQAVSKYQAQGRVLAAGALRCAGRGVTHEIEFKVWGGAAATPVYGPWPY